MRILSLRLKRYVLSSEVDDLLNDVPRIPNSADVAALPSAQDRTRLDGFTADCQKIKPDMEFEHMLCDPPLLNRTVIFTSGGCSIQEEQ